MTRYLLLAAAISLAPFAAIAQGVPVPVITEATRAAGSAVSDGINANRELIEKERTQPTQLPAAAETPAPAPALAPKSDHQSPNPAPSR